MRYMYFTVIFPFYAAVYFYFTSTRRDSVSSISGGNTVLVILLHLSDSLLLVTLQIKILHTEYMINRENMMRYDRLNYPAVYKAAKMSSTLNRR